MSCRVYCSVPVPSVYLCKLEQLLHDGNTSRFYSAISFTADVVLQMQILWDPKCERTSWKFYTLPTGTAFEWAFLCSKKEHECVLVLRFTDCGFLFIQIYDKVGNEKGNVFCHEFHRIENIADQILSLLESSVN